ncbi:hypothetical protein [Fischerella sp. PCC 9605]|uniref:hypothetical protein n=1 Tax=Fischerella sp. PCC 9605 TaxID=1173024 RepID=UPI0004B7D76D|nr:hypothetical protein [Fischerella sp. PCC 9605]
MKKTDPRLLTRSRGFIPLLLLRGEKNTDSTLNLKQSHELRDRIPDLSFTFPC